MGEKGVGKVMTTKELDSINLECDLIAIVNQHAWPHGDKIVKKLLGMYNVSPKDKSRKIPAANFKGRETC